VREVVHGTYTRHFVDGLVDRVNLLAPLDLVAH
jgi:hypothetical protein